MDVDDRLGVYPTPKRTLTEADGCNSQSREAPSFAPTG